MAWCSGRALTNYGHVWMKADTRKMSTQCIVRYCALSHKCNVLFSKCVLQRQ